MDESRLHCTMLLDQLIRLAETDEHPRNRDLGEIARQYAGVDVDKTDPFRLRYGETIGKDWSQLDPGFLEYAIKDAIATQRSFVRMQARALQLARRHGVQQRMIEQYGVLTLSLQVKAAIALDLLRRNGIQLDLVQLQATRERLLGEIQRLTEVLLQLPDTADLFRRVKKTGCLVHTAAGKPSICQQALLRRLSQVADQHQIEVPRTPRSDTPTRSTKFWSRYQDLSPFVQRWIQLEETAKLLTFFAALRQDRIHPTYTTLTRTGRTTCCRPNIQQLPRQAGFREMAVAAPGTYLFIIDYAAIELRTLAAVCLKRFGRSLGRDPAKWHRSPRLHGGAVSRRGLRRIQ